MHGRIASVATSVLGVDASDRISPEGLVTGPRSRIVRGDVMDLAPHVAGRELDVIVAGEVIEHLPNPQQFLLELKRLFPGRELLATTPNATSITNVLLAAAARESNHPDHTQVFSYKTLNTLCLRAGFESWEIRPYYVRYSEMQLRLGGWRGAFVRAVEGAVNAVEYLFPLLAGGIILHVHRI